MKSKKIGIALIAVGVVLIIAAAFMSFSNKQESDTAGERSERLLEKFTEMIPAQRDAVIPESASDSGENGEKTGSDNGGGTYADTDNLPDGEISYDGAWEGVRSESLVKIEEHDICGYIQIPKLLLSLPVMSDYSEENLRWAPCRYTDAGTPEGKLVVAGHNYTTHFGRLGDVEPGDKVVFVNADGERYTFKVSEVMTVDNDDFGALEEGEWVLSLFTCNFSGEKRILVRCIVET